MMTTDLEPLTTDGSLIDYARRLDNLRAVQLAAGESITAFFVDDNPAALHLAYKFGEEASRLKAELAGWERAHLVTAVTDAAGISRIPVQRGTGGR